MVTQFRGYSMGGRIYLTFADIHVLCDYILPKFDEVKTVLCSQDEATKMMQDLLSRNNVDISWIDIDVMDYDGEYLVFLMKKENGRYGLFIEAAYTDNDHAKYAEGIILCSMRVPYKEYIDKCAESVHDSYQRFAIYGINDHEDDEMSGTTYIYVNF